MKLVPRVANTGEGKLETHYALIAIFAILGPLFVGGALIASAILAPKFPNAKDKFEAYESGEKVFGTARIQFKVGYYLFALLFMVFDVEALFLFPTVKLFREIKLGHIPSLSLGQIWVELAIFIFILSFGLLFAWRKKVLEWE